MKKGRFYFFNKGERNDRHEHEDAGQPLTKDIWFLRREKEKSLARGKDGKERWGPPICPIIKLLYNL
jgi:hypothetical protein